MPSQFDMAHRSTFQHWLKLAKAEIAQRHGRRTTVLLVDNFPGHQAPCITDAGTEVQEVHFPGDIRGFQFDFMYIIFLPPNVTSDVQPLDQEIILSWKVRRSIHLNSFMEIPYTADIFGKSEELDTLHSFQAKWRRLQAEKMVATFFDTSHDSAGKLLQAFFPFSLHASFT